MVCGEGQALPVPMVGLITLRCFIKSSPLYAQCVGQDTGVHATTQGDGQAGVFAHCFVVSSGQISPVPQCDLVILKIRGTFVTGFPQAVGQGAGAHFPSQSAGQGGVLAHDISSSAGHCFTLFPIAGDLTIYSFVMVEGEKPHLSGHVAGAHFPVQGAGQACVSSHVISFLSGCGQGVPVPIAGDSTIKSLYLDSFVKPQFVGQGVVHSPTQSAGQRSVFSQ